MLQLQKQPRGLSEDSKAQILRQAYDQAMERVDGQKAGLRTLALQVLSWITCAKRPLSTLELQHALAVEPGQPELDEDNLPQIEDMVSVCAGLVTVDEESGIIRLVHYTTQEYFERTLDRWFPDAHHNIADTCVTYLSFHILGTYEERDHYPLYRYSVQNWGHHAREASSLPDSVFRFLADDARCGASLQYAMILDGFGTAAFRNLFILIEMEVRQFFVKSEKVTDRAFNLMNGLHLAAWFGLKEAVKRFLNEEHFPHPEFALSHAAERGHQEVVEFLLEKDIGINKNALSSPLSDAVTGGYYGVVELLLKNGANPDQTKVHGVGNPPFIITPLQLAAIPGTADRMHLLLNYGADYSWADRIDSIGPLANRRETVALLIRNEARGLT